MIALYLFIAAGFIAYASTGLQFLVPQDNKFLGWLGFSAGLFSFACLALFLIKFQNDVNFAFLYLTNILGQLKVSS
jgi:hypothetical protein